ncbi:MAG: hypothetical protein ACI4D5_07440 [Kineothrix sp.]
MRKKRNIAIFFLLLAVAAVGTAACAGSKSRELPISVNGEEVSQEEYLQSMKECKFYVERYFAENFDADIEAGDFWESDFDGENPCRKLTEDTIDAILKQRAVYSLAEERGYIEDGSYAGTVKRMEEENRLRAEKIKNNEVVYGLTSYSLPQWLDYEEGILREAFCNDLNNEEMQLSEEERTEFFENGVWTDQDGIPGITIEELGSGFDQELRKAKYDDLIEKRAEEAELLMDEKAVYEFTLEKLQVKS